MALYGAEAEAVQARCGVALPDSGQQVLVLAEDVLQEGLLELGDLVGIHLVQMTSDPGVDDRHLLLNSHGA